LEKKFRQEGLESVPKQKSREEKKATDRLGHDSWHFGGVVVVAALHYIPLCSKQFDQQGCGLCDPAPPVHHPLETHWFLRFVPFQSYPYSFGNSCQFL
jgi:hypothetical protein